MSDAPKTIPTISPEEDLLHPNEHWWEAHGGENWLNEIQARLPNETHYRQQQAFLSGFFLGIQRARVLDFGCGYGRHLRSLREIPELELHGCDISQKMVETAVNYLADPEFARDRIRLVKTRSPLPYEDAFFDVAFTSEVLIHVDTVDVLGIARELWRVSSSLIVHIENRPVPFSQRENSAHGGCWLHNFKQIYEEIGPAEVITMPDAIEKQCIYIVMKPGSKLATAATQWADSQLSQRLAQELSSEKAKVVELRQALAKREEELEEAEKALDALQASVPLRLAESARSLPFAPIVGRGLARLARSALPPPASSRSRKLRREEESPEPGPADLSFAGIATRASKLSAEEFVQEQPRLVAVCHPHWRGIRAATYGQSQHVLEVPGIASEEHCQRLIRFLDDCGTEQIVVNGFPPRIDTFLFALRRELPKVRAYFVYHGTPAQFHFREDRVLHQILQLVEAGAVLKVGLVKSGLAEYFRALGYPAEYVMNICRLPFRPPRPDFDLDGKVHLGVFAPLICHKNVQTQLIAALMLPGSVVHMCELPEVAYLEQTRDRIVDHGLLPRSDFLGLLSQMHATLYVSLVECYPMTVLESLSAGAVCLTSHTSTLFNGRPDLLEALVVREHDNPYAIARQLVSAIEKRVTLVRRAQEYIEELNLAAEKRWEEFLQK